MSIKVLEPEIVSLIAAGEVVERPASVVKELVENSLDAGASQISVEIKGSSFIRVMDNGAGIPADELEIAFQRHATSKISGVRDLDSIATLGFRGEALPSITAVAQVEMVTRTAESLNGSLISLDEGKVTQHISSGHAQGTSVMVRNLFRNLPARLKFLKSAATENSHVASVVSQYALAYPGVKFTLSIDNRITLRTPGNGQLLDSIIAIYGLEVARNMLEIGIQKPGWESSNPSIKVDGMVSSPAINRSSREYSFFVNRRWINSRLLSWAVEEAYHGLLMTGKHPIAVINITLPPQEIDVNIHPTKSEVKFRDEHLVFAAVQRAVRRVIIEDAPVPRIEEPALQFEALHRPILSKYLHGEVHPFEQRTSMPQTPMFSLPALRLLGQLVSTYIVAEGPDGLYLIDQHAAHERILFERIKGQRAGRGIEVQGLLEPAIFEVSPVQAETMKDTYQALGEFGFSLEPFGDRSFLVRTVPATLHNKDWVGTLREMLDSPDSNGWQERLIISIACHSAVKAGKVLTDDEMREMVRQLEQVAIPNTCPHGRPTMIHLTSGQLSSEFGRTG